MVDDYTGRIVKLAGIDESLLRLPTDSDEAESHVVDANRRGRRAALQRLDEWFPTVGFNSLPQTTDATTMHAGRAADHLVSHLHPEQLVDDLLTYRSLRPPQIRVARDAEDGDVSAVLEPKGPNPISRVGVRPGVLAKALDEGFTGVFDGVDLRDARSSRLAEVFERAYGTMININGYLSLRPQTSFGAHWDTQEVLILQLLGRKNWTVHQPVALSMTRESYSGESIGAPVWDGQISPGHILYVPRGWAHQVASIDELSYHYTITIGRLHGVDALSQVVDGLDGNERGRDTIVQAPIVADELDTWADPFSQDELAVTDRMLDRVLALRRLGVFARPTQKLSLLRDTLADPVRPALVRFPCGGGWVVGEHSEPDRINLFTARKGFDVCRGDVAAIMALTDGEVHAVSDRSTLALAHRLLRLDILEVVEDPLPWPFGVAG